MRSIRLFLKVIFLVACLAWAAPWLVIGALVMVLSAGFGFLWGFALWYVALLPLGWWLGHGVVKGIERRSKEGSGSTLTDAETVEIIVWG